MLNTEKVALTLEPLDDKCVPAGFAATAAGAGALPEVIVQRPDGAELARVMAFDPSFRSGVNAIVGELDGNDKTIELVAAARAGGGPHVRAFTIAKDTGVVTPLAEVFAFDAKFRGGVNVAIGDLDGSGTAEIITAAGPGGGPHVRAFPLANGSFTPFNGANGDFFAFDSTFRGGVNIVAGNLDNNAVNGDELVLTDNAQIRVLNTNGLFAAFTPFAGSFILDGVNAGALNVRNEDGDSPGFVFDAFGQVAGIIPAFDSDFVGPLPLLPFVAPTPATATALGTVPTNLPGPSIGPLLFGTVPPVNPFAGLSSAFSPNGGGFNNFSTAPFSPTSPFFTNQQLP